MQTRNVCTMKAPSCRCNVVAHFLRGPRVLHPDILDKRAGHQVDSFSICVLYYGKYACYNSQATKFNINAITSKGELLVV